jgi:hypothetical protein
MAQKEKARQNGEPIPNAVCQDIPEIKPQPLDLQVSLVAADPALRHHAAAAAATIARLAYAVAR